MANDPEAPLLLAGFALAHAAWSICDLPRGELLCPLAVTEDAEGRVLIRYDAATQEEAIARAKEETAAMIGGAKSLAFVRENISRKDGGTTDQLTTDYWGAGMEVPGTVFQAFRSAWLPGGFRLLGPPTFFIWERGSGNPTIVVPNDCPGLVDVLDRGALEHPHASSLWSEWRGAK